MPWICIAKGWLVMVLATDRNVAECQRPEHLPDFESPPVVEVVLGVQFSVLRKFRTIHPGILWNSKFRNEFPKFVEKLPLSSVFETFGGPTEGAKAPRTSLQLVQAQGPSVPRLWFMNEKESELLQIQSDRFLHNWRKGTQQEPYPRYETIREKFFHELDQIEDFFDEEKIGQIDANQCEVIYVNHISLPDGSDPGAQLERIFLICSSNKQLSVQKYGGGDRQKVENMNFGIRTVMLDSSGNPYGRLHVQVASAISSEGKPIISMELTARGAPMGPSYQGIADFLDRGRETIVLNFTNLTTQEMHDYWGKNQ